MDHSADLHYFYTPTVEGNTHRLSEEESKHAIRVLRLTEGDKVMLMDGKGSYYEGEIQKADPKACVVSLLHKTLEQRKDFFLHLAVAPTKLNERFEWFLEKATEIGIDEISPIVCSRSERKEIKQERMEKVIVAAAKQSKQAWFPSLNEIKTFDKVLKEGFKTFDKFICHCQTSDLPLLKLAYKKGRNAIILIGPEGDFTEAEIQKALEAGYKPVSLGKSRLRTETAAVVACHTINLINE